jgi:CubicO group peptidase (beta-lactamase class C family)
MPQHVTVSTMSDRGASVPEGSDAAAVARWIVASGVAPMAAAGCAVRRPEGWRVEVGGDVAALFDLASLTKPMTAVAAARSSISRHARLDALLPEAAGSRSAAVTLELLLAHRAGLDGHVALFEPLIRGEAIDRAEALAIAANARRDDAPGAIPAEGFAPVYSDVGYILAGAALARHEGAADAGAVIDARVVRPLGLDLVLGTARDLEGRGVDLARHAAPTEVVAWRGGEVRGRVHDENAWALTGTGGSGHAGMFGTIGAVLAFACEVDDALREDESPLAWLVARRPGGTLRAGFDGKSDEGSSCGERAGPDTYGHLGFTGTSVWIDPHAGTVVALLTNRVHPTRENVAIRAARPAAHDALFARARVLA